MSFFKIAVGLVLLVGVNLSFAQGNNLPPTSEYFIDSACSNQNNLPFRKFRRHEGTNFLLTTSLPVWIRINLKPEKEESLVWFSSSLIDSVTLYGDELQHSGERVKFQEKAFNTIIPAFRIPPHKDSITLLFRIINRDEISIFTIETGTYTTAHPLIERRVMIMSGFVILILAVFILNFVVYGMVRNKLSLAFMIFSFFTFCLVLISSGIAKLLSPDLPYYLGPLLVPVTGCLAISGVFLSINILRIKSLLPRMYKLLLGFVAIIGVAILLHAAGARTIAANIINPIGALIIPIYLYASWKAFKNGQPYALSYLLGWLIYYLVIFILVMILYGILLPGPNIIYMIPSISVIDFFFIAITIFGKVSHYRNEKEKADREYLRFVNDQNVLLEEKVLERTRQQEDLNKEIATQNEELQQQKEQIILLNESLEKMVEERTSELSYALINLEKRNLDLENFSHVVSHNLRGPVASILGLMQVYEQKRPGNPTHEELINYMKVTVMGLDKVIRDLNQILTIKHVAKEEHVEVYLQDVMDLTLSLLSAQIQDSNANIQYHFDQPQLKSIPAYVQNIFFNLISNSIKYSKPGTAPVISVSEQRHGDSHRFTFRDEGAGIDIQEDQRDMIFKMYYRVNKSTEGKGIGLYLVKCQVETLGGTIEVKTALGQGTTFIIDLPA